MEHNTKDIADMLTTVDDWLATIDRMQQQPEFAHSEFFSLLADIITDAKQGRRKEELLHKCQQAAVQAQTLYNETGMPQFAEWGICLADYAKTWTDSDDPALFANPLLQAEIAFLQEQAAEQNDPIKNFTSSLLNAEKAFQESNLTNFDSIMQAGDAIHEMTAPLLALKTYLEMFGDTEQGQQLKNLMQRTEAFLTQAEKKVSKLVGAGTLLSYLDEEIKKPKYNGLTLKEIIKLSKDEHGGFKEGSLFMQACAAADKAMNRSTDISKREAAKNMGALLTIGDRQVTITDRTYQFSLTFHENNNAYLVALKEDVFEQGIINENTGEFDLKLIANAERADMAEIDLSLLTRFFTAAYRSSIYTDSHTITVYFPSFCHEMGIKATHGNANDLFKHINAYRKLYGIIGKSSCYKVFEILGFDAQSNTLTFASPYMNQILYRISSAKEREVKTKAGELKYVKESYSFLIHSDIVKERNKTAVEIINCIIALIFQRGLTPDCKLHKNKNVRFREADRYKVSCHISFETVIIYTPLLQERLDSQPDISNKNKILKSSFSKAYKLLQDKTDLYSYYMDLKISDIVPTFTRLSEVIIVTHNGRNGDYSH